jgi:hypothetical protein
MTERAYQDLDADLGHLVAFGISPLANPDLGELFKQGVELNHYLK